MPPTLHHPHRSGVPVRRRRVVIAAITLVCLGVGVLAATSATADPTRRPSPTTPTSRPPASVPVSPASPSSPPAPSGTANPSGLPSAPASPSTAAVMPTGTAPENGGGNPWGWDIAGTVANAVMAFLDKVAAQTGGPVFDLLGRTVLATPDLTHQAEVRALWTACLAAADTGFVLFIVIAGVQLASRQTLQSRYGFKQLVPRLLIGMVAANCSLPLITTAIQLANAVTAAVTHGALDGKPAQQAIHQIVAQALHQHNFLESCLELGVIVLGVAVLVSFIARLAILILLIAASPLALACFALPQTEGVARLWCRGVAGVLAIQIAQAVTLVAIARVFLTPRAHLFLGLPTDAASLINLLVAATLLWIMCKIPGWVRRVVFRQPITLLPGRPQLMPRTVSRVVKGVIVARTLGALGLAGHSARAATAHRPRAGSTARSTASVAQRPRRTATAGSARRPTRTHASGQVRRSARVTAPAAFSHAPTVQTPLAAAAGSAAAPAFSHAPSPAAARRSGSVPPRRPQFSHEARPQPPTSAPTPASAPRFSHAQPAAPTPPANTAPAAPRTVSHPAQPVFSDAPSRQSAPKRPPAPGSPVFSDAPKPAPTRGSRRRRPDRKDIP